MFFFFQAEDGIRDGYYFGGPFSWEERSIFSRSTKQGKPLNSFLGGSRFNYCRRNHFLKATYPREADFNEDGAKGEVREQSRSLTAIHTSFLLLSAATSQIER